jgi:hypothetical protein
VSLRYQFGVNCAMAEGGAFLQTGTKTAGVCRLRAGVGEYGRATAAREQALGEGEDGGGVRRAARGARPRVADAQLTLHSLQVNFRGGPLPEPESNGKRFLKIPLDALDGAPWDE